MEGQGVIGNVIERLPRRMAHGRSNAGSYAEIAHNIILGIGPPP